MQLLPKLQPFWFEPPYQEPGEAVRFQLRPLTQAEMIECEDLYKEGQWTRIAQYRAGMTSIVACDGISDADGKPVRWGRGAVIGETHGKAGQELRSMVVLCGLRILTEMNGQDWAAIIAEANRKAEGDDALPPEKQPAEASPTKILPSP